MNEGTATLIRPRAFANSWLLRCPRRLSLRRRRSHRTDSTGLVVLEPRALMANLPVLIGPLATPAISIGSNQPSPWLNGLGDPHHLRVISGDPESAYPRLVDRSPRILGPIGFLQPPSRMADHDPGPPEDSSESLPEDNPAPSDPPSHTRRSIDEARILVNGQATPEVAFADQRNGLVTVFVDDQVVFQVAGLSHPAGVKLADIDNDGTPDLLIADSGNDRVLIYRGSTSGGFRAELMDGAGLKVGEDPVSLTVGDVDGDGLADLIVTNRGSNSVSILKGRGLGLSWSLGLMINLQAGTAPVQSLLITPEAGRTDTNLLICNKGSNNIYRYQAAPGERLGDQSPQIIDVGLGPEDMLVGRFDRRPDLALVTVNSGSDSLSYIGGVFTAYPTRQEITASGFHPLSAIPLTIDNSGVSDLMIANTDGRITFLQAGDNGLQLTGLIAPTGLANVTAIKAGSWMNGSLALYEASNDFDSIAMLRFTIDNLTSTEDEPVPALPITGLPSSTESDIDVEIVPVGASTTDLAGVLWTRTPDVSAADSAESARDAKGSRRAIQAAGLHHEDPLDLDRVMESSQPSEDDLLDDDPSAGWTRYVLGLDAALGSFSGEVAALAATDPDHLADDWWIDFHATQRFVAEKSIERHDAARDLPRFSLDPPTFRAELSSGFRPISRSESDGVASDHPRLATVAIGATIAVRLLVKTSPPRPRAGQSHLGRIRRGRVHPWPEVFPQTLRMN